MILDDIKKANMVALKEKNQTARNIYSIVMKTGKIKVFDIFSMAKSRSDLVASFLAILEMTKNKKILLTGELENLSIEIDFNEEEADENGYTEIESST